LLNSTPKDKPERSVNYIKECNRIGDVFIPFNFVRFLGIFDFVLVVGEILGVHEVQHIERGKKRYVYFYPLESVAHGEVNNVDCIVRAIDVVSALVEKGVQIPNTAKHLPCRAVYICRIDRIIHVLLLLEFVFIKSKYFSLFYKY
jgi:hypothetical protein